MADKKNNDSLFQWNFNLEDSDSDFTDIDFSSSNRNDASDKDIEPIIFVRDETARKNTDLKRPQTQNSAAAQTAKKTQTASAKTASRPAARKTTAKKKKKSSAVNWPLIAVIAVIVVLVVLLIILLSQCGKKEDKAWTKVEADSKVQTLMDRYFEAKKTGSAENMRKIREENAVVNASTLAIEAAIYKDYADISLQQYPGIKDNEYVICATYDTVLTYVDASVPTISWFYAQPDSSKNLRLMPITDKDEESNATIYNYVKAAAALLADTTVKDVQTRYNNALESNPDLVEYLQNIEKGNYYTKPTGSSTEEEPANNSTEDETPAAGTVMYVRVGDSFLKMRSTASKADDSNVIKKLQNGYCVTVLSIDEYGWAHIVDDISINPASSEQQDPSGRTGYVDVRYITANYSETQ